MVKRKDEPQQVTRRPGDGKDFFPGPRTTPGGARSWPCVAPWWHPRRVHTSELEEALAAFEDLALAGTPPDPGAFCAQHPRLPDLGRHLQLLQALRGALPRAAGQLPRVGDDFALLRPLGRGGMGEVYLARQRAPRRLCAVKVLQWANARNVRRFEREANIMARLDHPGIAAVLAAGHQHGGVAYLALQLVYGVSLRSLLQSTDLAVSDEDWLTQVLQAAARATSRDALSTAPMPAPVAVDLLLQAAQALAYAHDAGVVHRDVKPTNLMVSTTGQVKLIDFGVAATLQDEEASGEASTDPLTASGAFIGSFDYAAPEQLRGDRAAVGPWSDTFAAGATLFECLTQRLPYPAGSLAERLQQADAALPASPRQLDHAVPRGLDALVRKALDPRPQRRFEDGAALAAALQESREALSVRRAMVSLRLQLPGARRWGWGALGWAAALVCAALGVANHLRHQDAEAALESAMQRRDQAVFADVLLRHHEVFEACIDQNPTPPPFTPGVLAPRFEATALVRGEAAQSVEVSSYTRNLNKAARACMARALKGLEYPGVGLDAPRALNADVVLLHAK